MEIIPMTEAHVFSVAKLEAACFSMPWSENSVRGELTNDLSLWLVAIDGDTLVGYIGSQTCGEESDMMNVAVAPEYRRQGIAEALVKALCSSLANQGASSLTLEVRASNTSAIMLYEKLSFVQIGRRPRYYTRPTEDALIFRKELFV